MHTRPATVDDIALAAELVARADTAWFGAPEHDEGEIREFLGQVDKLETSSRLLFDDDRLIAIALHNDTDPWFVIDPDPELTRRAADDLISWFSGFDKPHLQVLDRDTVMRDALAARGWAHHRSAFDLLRTVSDDWVIGEPAWPDGVQRREFTPDDAEALHHLIYVDAAWAEVPGHPHREYPDWRSIFITEHTKPELQSLAWRGDRLVGAAIGRIFSDDTGWVAQLAVAKSERGRGLGRALLLDALRRRRDAGAKMLGLAVQADNRGALRLYLDAGLQIDREWMEYRPR